MNPKTKKTTNLPRSKLGIAGAVFSLWAIAVYSAGLLNPLQASQDTTLKVNGVQNHVQYLTSLVITGTNGNVEFKYHQATNSVQALGALNMQNIVIEDKNAKNTVSNPSAVILGGTGNTNNGQNSVIIGGERTVNGGQNNLLINTPKSNAQSFNTAIIRGERVRTDGKNIFVNNANNAGITGDNIFINGSSSSERGNNVAIFGSKVTNTKSNVFIFNGNDAVFTPNLDSAFYANGKVAINGSNAEGTLHVHGGVMVQNRESDYKSPNQSGIIALFSRGVQKGLCGYDGKMRVPLSESARLYGLCAPRGDIVGTRPANAVSNWETILPQVWNQQKWKWETRKWIYGSDTKPGYFLCKDGFVPYPTDALGKTNDGFVRNPTDALGKTDITCEKCETAKKGDLNCPEKAAPKPELTPVQPPVPVQPTCSEPGTTWNGTICTGTRSLKCLPNPGTNGTFSDGVQTYNGATWETTTHCTLNCNSGYEKKTGTDWREYCAELETYTWKCEQKAGDRSLWKCQESPNSVWICKYYRSHAGVIKRKMTEKDCKVIDSDGHIRWIRRRSIRTPIDHNCNLRLSESSCKTDESCSRSSSTTTESNSYSCINNSWRVVADSFCVDKSKPECSFTLSCTTDQHLENGACVSNTKTVSCDHTWINSENGRVNNPIVSVTRSETAQSWSNPAKCTIECNNGYILLDNKCIVAPLWTSLKMFNLKKISTNSRYSTLLADSKFQRIKELWEGNAEHYGLNDAGVWITEWIGTTTFAAIFDFDVLYNNTYLLGWGNDNYGEIYIDGYKVGGSLTQAGERRMNLNWRQWKLKPISLNSGRHSVVIISYADWSGLDGFAVDIYNLRSIEDFVKNISSQKPETIFTTKSKTKARGLMCNNRTFISFNPNNTEAPFQCTTSNPYTN